MEKTIFFDAGPIISLVMSRLAHILPKLKEKFGGKFYITPAVKRELIERPLQNKRFELEALEVMKMVRDGVLEVYQNVPQQKVKQLSTLANSSFKINKRAMDVVQEGEMESIASALAINSSALVIDERTLRLFIEDSKNMEKLLEHRFRRDVIADPVKMKKFSEQLKGVTIIRSIELISVAYKLGLLNSYIPKLRNGKNMVIDATLWAAKFNGCAVTEHEIEEIKSLLLKP